MVGSAFFSRAKQLARMMWQCQWCIHPANSEAKRGPDQVIKVISPELREVEELRVHRKMLCITTEPEPLQK